MRVIKNIKQQLAFSIIEILVAMGIFSMIAATGVIAVLHSLSMTRLGLEKNKAVLLIDEGFDAVRSIKRRSWSNLDSIDCSLGCGLDNGSGVWELTSTADDIDGYTRTVFIQNAKRDSLGMIIDGIGSDDQNLKEVEVSIDWNFNEVRANNVSSRTYLAHHESPIFQSADILANWPFSEGFGATTDSSNSLTATINGATWMVGAIGSALKFNGSTDYVELNDAESLIANNQLSIVAWVNPSDRSGGRIYVMKGSEAGTYNYQFGQYDRKLYFGVGDNDGSYVMSGNTIQTNQWQQVAVVVDGLEVKLFYNGELISTEQLDVAVIPVAGNLFFGSELGQDYFFEGILDQVEIYNKILTDAEILEKYDLEVATILPPILQWPFNDLSGADATETVNAETGVLNGGTTWTDDLKGGALNFDGVDAYVDLDNSLNTIQNLIKSQGSLSFWTKIERKSGSQYLFHIYDQKRAKELRIEYQVNDPSYEDQLRFIFGSWDYRILYTYQYMPVQMQAGDGQWHQLVLTWDTDGEMLAYVDGQVFGPAVNISAVGWNPKLTEVCLATKCPAASGNTPTQLFQGDIDHLEFFDVVLSGEEVLSKYNEFIN
jgi:type II secretory pathway pseudopilin PulG